MIVAVLGANDLGCERRIFRRNWVESNCGRKSKRPRPIAYVRSDGSVGKSGKATHLLDDHYSVLILAVFLKYPMQVSVSDSTA